MELTTFSMVLRFTLQLEDQTTQFYRSVAEKFSPTKELFSKFAQNSERRKKDLERTARESIDHSLLEPVSGLLEETYKMNIDMQHAASMNDAISAAKKLEETMQKYYEEAGDKINFISNVSRLYRKYAQDRAKALASLQEYT
jgi:rubrerythrin